MLTFAKCTSTTDSFFQMSQIHDSLRHLKIGRDHHVFVYDPEVAAVCGPFLHLLNKIPLVTVEMKQGRKTGLSPHPSIFILTVPRRYFCCGSLL